MKNITRSRLLIAHALGGAAGAFVLGLLEGLTIQGLLVYALLGGLIIGAAEIVSWAGVSRWSKGILFGVTAGVLGAMAGYVTGSPEQPFLQWVIIYALAGAVGGLIWKGVALSANMQHAA